MPFDGQLSLFVALGCRYVPLLVARARFPDVNKMVSANAKVGLTLAATAFATYLFTIYTLKSQSPGDLNEMEPLPPSEKALQAAIAQSDSANAKTEAN